MVSAYPSSLPAGVWPIRWTDQGHSPLEFALLAYQPEATTPPVLCEMNRSVGLRSYLAAVLDGDRHVFAWFEVVVQVPSDFSVSPAARTGLITNASLDAQWAHAQSIRQALSPASSVKLPDGVTASLSKAWVVDWAERRLRPWTHPDNPTPVELCRDDRVLLREGKPAYTTSLERWFRAGESGPWISHSQLRERIAPSPAPSTSDCLDFTSAAGQLAIYRASPLTLDGFLLALAAPGEAVREDQVDVSQPAAPNSLDEMWRRSFVGTGSTWRGWVPGSEALERFYLRLSLWSRLVALVLDHCRASRQPLFNLATDSFRIEIPATHGALPPAWMAEPSLVKPGEVVTLALNGQTHFVPTSPSNTRRHGHHEVGWKLDTGSVRFTQVFDLAERVVRIEGFLDSPALRHAAAETLIWVELRVRNLPLVFSATIDLEHGLARSGARFRAERVDLPPEILQSLRSAASPKHSCQIALFQPVAATYDVHLLGLIGLRMLLAVDEAGALELSENFFDLAALLPVRSGIEHLKLVAATPEISQHLKRLLSPENWVRGTGHATFPAELWLATLHELLAFITVDGTQVETGPDWLGPLVERAESLGQLCTHVRGLLLTPRAAEEEIGRVVHRFTRS